MQSDEKVEELSKALDNTTISLAEAEDQLEKFKVEGAQVSFLTSLFQCVTCKENFYPFKPQYPQANSPN